MEWLAVLPIIGSWTNILSGIYSTILSGINMFEAIAIIVVSLVLYACGIAMKGGE